MCEKEDQSKRVETDVYINGEHYVQVTIYDYYGRIVFQNTYKQ